MGRSLRAGVGGLMRHHEAFVGVPLKPLLPLKTDVPDEGCIRAHSSQHCFLAGGWRVWWMLPVVDCGCQWCKWMLLSVMLVDVTNGASKLSVMLVRIVTGSASGLRCLW